MKTALPLAMLVFVFASGGCSTGGKNILGGSATGIPECDKLFDKVEKKTAGKNLTSNNVNAGKDASYVFLRDDIVPSLRKEMAKPGADKKELGKMCDTAYEAFVPKEDQ